jgi:hypothetical protein
MRCDNAFIAMWEHAMPTDVRPKKRRSKSPPLHEDLLLIGKPIGTSGIPWHIAFDISESEYMLFGSVVFYWSFLEHALRVRTIALAKLAKVTVPAEANNYDFRRRLAAFRRLVETSVKSETAKQKWLNVIKRIEQAKAGREHVAHNFWTYNPKKPDQLWSTDMRRRGARSGPFDVDRLRKLGALLGEVNFDLIFPRKPIGRNQSMSYMSRSFRLMMMGKPRLDS